MKRLCMDCGNLLHGRIDKKFCDDQCRSNYNNKIKTGSNNVVKMVNHILRKNRQLLEKFNPNGKTKVSSVTLIAAGFDPNYHTHSYCTQKGDTYLFCYEYGYLKLATNDFLLVKKDLR